MSGATWHADLPWTRLRMGYKALRTTVFSAPRPKGVYLRVQRPTGRTLHPMEESTPFEDNLDRIVRAFGGRSWAPNWEFSYNKRGEVLNLARVTFAEDSLPDGLRWGQYHVRGWPGPNGTVDLGGHFEAEPTEHPKPHLDAEGFNRPAGMNKVRAVLSDEGLPWNEVEYVDE